MKVYSITVDCRMISCAGIGTFIKGLLSALKDDKRFTLTLLYLRKDKKKLPKGASLIEMECPTYSIKEQVEWVKKIPKCTLFFSPHFTVPLLPIKAKKRMTAIHDVFHLAHFSTLNWPQKIYAKIMYNGASFLSDQIVTISQFSRAEIEKYLSIKPKKIRVVLNGIHHCGKIKDLQAVKKKYRLPDSFVLAVGNVKPHKNLSRLFEAYEGDIVVVGKIEGFITGMRLEKRPNIHFVGEVLDEEIPAFYQLAQVLVFPSLYEGFGYPPLEAMAWGCPVVASNRGSILEVCSDAAEFIDPNDVSSIRNGINAVLNNNKRREELISKGLSHVKKYDLQSRVKELTDVIYESCCSS